MSTINGLECNNLIKQDGSTELFYSVIDYCIDNLPLFGKGMFYLSFAMGLFTIDVYLDVSIEIRFTPDSRSVNVVGAEVISLDRYIDLVYERDKLLQEAYEYSKRLIQGL